MNAVTFLHNHILRTDGTLLSPQEKGLFSWSQK